MLFRGGGYQSTVLCDCMSVFFFADRVEEMKIGLRGPHFAKLTSGNLSELVEKVLSDPIIAVNCKRMQSTLLSRRSGQVVVAERIHDGVLRRKKVKKEGE